MTVTQRVGARELRTMLQARGFDVLGKLFPASKITAPVFTPLNPTRADTRPGSFVIWTSGAAFGGFTEYSPKGPPASGDILDLVAYVHNRGGDRSFAYAWASDFLGLKKLDAQQLAAAKQRAAIAQQSAVKTESDKQIRARQQAFKIWLDADPAIAGTIAETYYASRGIAYASLQNAESDLRFHPRLEWWKGIKWEGRRYVAPGPRLPAIVAAARSESGDITGVHCTFLRNDGRAKADVDPPKLMRGVIKGSPVQITRGGSGMTLEEAKANGVLDAVIVAEGIENALSVALTVPEARVWAATAFDMLRFVPVWHPVVDRLVIAADNDIGRTPDQSAKIEEKLAETVDELAAFGKPVSVMRPPNGVKDFNDLLKGGA